MSCSDENLIQIFKLAYDCEKKSDEKALITKNMGEEIPTGEPLKLNEQKAEQKLIEYLSNFDYNDLLEIATFCHMGMMKCYNKKKNDGIYNSAQQYVIDFIVFNKPSKAETSIEKLIKYLIGPCVITKYLYDYFETRYENPFKGLK